MNDKETRLAIELAELWTCSRVHLPGAARAFVDQGNKANDVISKVGGAFAGSGHRMETAWSELLERYQGVMSASADNVYAACDVLDKVREAYAHNDGMNAARLGRLTRESIGAYTQQAEPPGKDYDGDGRTGESAGDLNGAEVVDPQNRPRVLDPGPNPLNNNPNYR